MNQNGLSRTSLPDWEINDGQKFNSTCSRLGSAVIAQNASVSASSSSETSRATSESKSHMPRLVTFYVRPNKKWTCLGYLKEIGTVHCHENRRQLPEYEWLGVRYR